MASQELKEIVGKLRDENPKVRRKACAELVKLGDLQAVQPLIKIYKADPDAKVREEAGKALAKFKGTYSTGKVSMGPSDQMFLLRNVLGGLLALLIVANIAYMLLGSGSDDVEPGQLSQREDLLALYSQSIDTLDTSTQAILDELTKVGPTDQDPDCDREIPAPSWVRLSNIDAYVYPDVYAAVAKDSPYDNSINTYNKANSDWRSMCRGSFAIEKTFALSDQLTAVRDNLPIMRTTLANLMTNPEATKDPAKFGTPTAPPTTVPSPTPTALPTATPEPIAGIDYQTHVTALQALYDTYAPSLEKLEDNWREAERGNTGTLSCIRPELGDAYVLPPDQTGDSQLTEAAQKISEGLELAKSNAAFFSEKCGLGELQAAATDPQGLPDIGAARLRFEEARILLEHLKGYLAQ